MKLFSVIIVKSYSNRLSGKFKLNHEEKMGENEQV